MSFIQANIKKYTVRQMCKVLKFPRSTYYAAVNHVQSQREQEYNIFSNQVLNVYLEFKKRYGAVKIRRELNDRNIPCSVKRVQRHMKHLEIKSIVTKKYQYQKNHGQVPDDKENILNRNFEADTVFKKLVTDITYIHVKNEGCLKELGIRHSFSRKGNPYDNACIESFHSVLKKEEVYTTTYNTFEEAKAALFEYIESFYNRKRRHSALNYRTPQQVEDEALSA